MSFQELILALQRFWASKGCLIQQPYDLEVGAGTFNPATLLRALGPEPWSVAYVEPSRRPTDGRYGENPNRLGHYYQYQVVIKPSPLSIQDIYLDSLRALGIDPLDHDIRFVEDDWESPTLGASGLGWEVWLDGMEITQFTYFQQAGSIRLDPISVEVTYGLERIAMYLQGKESVYDLMWNEKLTYGHVHQKGEWEHSRYCFEMADVDMLLNLFNLYEQESKRISSEGIASNAPMFSTSLRQGEPSASPKGHSISTASETWLDRPAKTIWHRGRRWTTLYWPLRENISPELASELHGLGFS